MISVFACTGYKHFGYEPPLSFHYRRDWREFRDNMTYLGLQSSDWEHDQEMLRFILDTHVRAIGFKRIKQAIQPYVQDNATPPLHLLWWQHSHDTKDTLRFSLELAEPVVERFGQQAVTAAQYIARKQAYYRAEYARYDAEEKAEASQRKQLEQEREERRQQRAARAARTKPS